MFGSGGASAEIKKVRMLRLICGFGASKLTTAMISIPSELFERFDSKCHCGLNCHGIFATTTHQQRRVVASEVRSSLEGATNVAEEERSFSG